MRLENAGEFFLYFCLKKKRTKLFLTWGFYTEDNRLCEVLVFRAAKKLPKLKSASYVKPKELFTENQSC